MKGRVRAFTLIELMVVLSIIGLLASVILTPAPNAIGKARDARLKEILNNLRIAIHNYYLVKGEYPQNLKALVPAYIKEVPEVWEGSNYKQGKIYYNHQTGEIGLLDKNGRKDNLPADFWGVSYAKY
jgi:prepilin-type N-terminal cleavage/methylation domain-containing protein